MFSGARIYSSTNQSVPNNTDTVLKFDSVRFDVGGYANLSTYPTRLTAPQTGYYLIGGSVAFPNGDFYSQIVILLNHDFSEAGQLCGHTTSVPAGNNNLTTNVVWKLNAGEFVELDAVQSSGHLANSLSAPAQCPEFWIAQLGI